MARAELMDYDKALELFEPVIGLEVHVELNTDDEDVLAGAEPGELRVPRRRAEHARDAPCASACRVRSPSSTAMRCARRSRSGSRSAARSPRRAASPARTTSTPTSRRTTRSRQYDEPIAFEGSVEVELANGRVVPGADRARAHGGGRRQAHARRRLDRPHPGRRVLARRLQPRGRAARRDRHEADLRRRGRRPRARQGLRLDDPRHRALARHLRGAHGARQPALRRERVAASARHRDARHPHRDEERELVPLDRAGRALRDPAPGRHPRQGRHDHAGDPSLARGHRHDQPGPPEVRRRRLPLLPRARPAAGRAVAGAHRGAARRAARAARGASPPPEGRVGLHRPRVPGRRERRPARRGRRDRRGGRLARGRAQVVDGRAHAGSRTRRTTDAAIARDARRRSPSWPRSSTPARSPTGSPARCSRASSPARDRRSRSSTPAGSRSCPTTARSSPRSTRRSRRSPTCSRRSATARCRRPARSSAPS